MKVSYLQAVMPARSYRFRYIQLVLCQLLFAMAMLTANSPAQAQGTPPGYEGKPLPAYPGQPKDCYQLLKNQYPYVQGGDFPVCLSVLRNFNKFCDQPPQYDRRQLHPETKDLAEPAWAAMPVMQNLDLVKETFLASNPPQDRQAFWLNERERVTGLAKAGKLKLSGAKVDLNLRFGNQTVYKLEGYYAPPVPAGYIQPRLMLTTQTKPRASSDLVFVSFDWAADLWRFRRSWYLVHFDPIEKRFVINELIRPGLGIEAPVGTLTRCTIMYAADNR